MAIIYAIRNTAAARARTSQPIRIRVRPVLRGRLGRLMVGVTASELGNAAATLLILRATDLFGPGRSQTAATQLALVLYVPYNLAASLISFPARWHGDRSNPIRVLAAGAAKLMRIGLAAAARMTGQITAGTASVTATVTAASTTAVPASRRA